PEVAPLENSQPKGMPPRHNRLPVPPRGPVAPVHRGPQAAALSSAALTSGSATPFHAPNAALLIDFDNVTMGVRSDLNAELRNLLSSDIVKGKVSVQRAYADWRRYPQYIVPLAESSIDLIFAPAYGSSKKNATDIRLAIDALELVFTRPEIGTFILLSGDSDFSSLVIKLKEYGKYVIGVGIRESSSDLLVQNCDEYYSYNALAGLVNAREEEVAKWDPWELAGEAVLRMKRNGDVMRADRLKQVMQQIDSSFDEKNLGMSKFTRFVQEASHRGILSAQKMENGQLEVDLAKPSSSSATASTGASMSSESGAMVDEEAVAGDASGSASVVAPESAPEPREYRDRGRRGRGRGRDREERRPRVEAPAETDVAAATAATAATTETTETTETERPTGPTAEQLSDAELPAPPAAPFITPTPPEATERGLSGAEPRGSAPVAEAVAAEMAAETGAIGLGGMRLTRDDAFNLMRDAVSQATAGGVPARASEVRRVAREILGRDSESLSERNFNRILMDAHDADVIDLRRRGNDYEVSSAIAADPIAEQLGAAETANAILSPRATAPPAPRGMGQRGAPPRGGRAQPAKAPITLDLLSVGVVDFDTPTPATVQPAPAASAPVETQRTHDLPEREVTQQRQPAPSTPEPTADPSATTTASKPSRPPRKATAAKKTTTKAASPRAADQPHQPDQPQQPASAAKTTRKKAAPKKRAAE
ncbi:MAG: NYN domain-containing protein, partial [Gemmatimonadaceae bacterium]